MQLAVSIKPLVSLLPREDDACLSNTHILLGNRSAAALMQSVVSIKPLVSLLQERKMQGDQR